MFSASKEFLKDCKDDVTRMIKLLNHANVDDSTILKSSIVMMIYNMVEGVFSVACEDFFYYLIENKIDIQKIKELYCFISLYYLKSIINETVQEKRIKLLHEFRDYEKMPVCEYRDFFRIVKPFSGNLDARRISNILKKFGIEISLCTNDETLKTIKDIRNDLAHGNKNYAVACRGMSSVDISQYFNNSYSLLERTITAMEKKACGLSSM